MKKLLALTFVLFVWSCGFATPAPVWKENAYRQLDEYVRRLSGREASTEPHFG